jgi:aldehyde:ferredoxin oxidoreductase
MLYGWVGTILDIDLNSGDIVKRPFTEAMRERFIGGRGLNSKTLYDNVGPKIDPFSPENVIMFSVGPAVGTMMNAGSRFTVTAKSPLSLGHGDANCGGYWGPELKFAGYDQIIFRGRAKKPVYLFIENDRVELRDASHMWGLDTWETHREMIKGAGDPLAQVVYIGPAGEKRVRFAGVLHNMARAAGRMGMGAVLGSKNVKGIVVRGTKGIYVPDPKAIREFHLDLAGKMTLDSYYPLFSTYGTLGLMEAAHAYGIQLVKNDWIHTLPNVEEIGGINFVERYALKQEACFCCALHCGNSYLVKEGPFAGTFGRDVEYAHTSTFGARGYNLDMAAILKLNEICDKYGFDPISAGVTLNWALDCYERGILTKEDTEGIDLSWGNSPAYVAVMEKIGKREGFLGNLLAEGSYRAAMEIGRGSEELLSTIKKVETMEYDPRAAKAWGLGFATSTRGADHLRAQPGLEFAMRPEEALEMFGTPEAANRLSHEGKGRMVAWLENTKAFVDSIGTCKFWARTVCLKPEILATMFNVATGSSYTAEDVMKAGERVWTVEKCFNIREGMRREDDSLPEKFKTPIVDGPNKGATVDFDRLLNDYYAYRGWDRETSLPSRQRLLELGLDDIAEELKGILSE